MHSLTLVLAAATMGLAFAASEHLTHKYAPMPVKPSTTTFTTHHR
ncbi:hypothetical protein [Acetobacter sp.]